MEKIVLGYDGSETVKKGIPFILDLAKSFPKLHVFIVHVISLEKAEDEAIDLTGMFSKANQERMEQIDKDFSALKDQGIMYSQKIMYGNPADKLVEFANLEDADLIMVGHRGLTPFREAFIGSVSRKVIRESHVPVYVIK